MSINLTNFQQDLRLLKKRKTEATRRANKKAGIKMDKRWGDELTSRQGETLECIIKICQEKGIPPTIKELADKMLVAVSAMQMRLVKLENKGYIRREPKLARMMTILKNPDGTPYNA